MSRRIRYTINENGIALLQIDLSNQNDLLDQSALEEIYKAMKKIEQDLSVRAVVITGTGKEVFIAGTDIRALEPMTAESVRKYSRIGQRTMNQIAEMKTFVIAAINGFTFGAGLELALSCDIRIASQTAVFRTADEHLNVLPGFGGAKRMIRLLGPAYSKELLMTGRIVSAQEARRIGLINEMTTPQMLLSHALALAEYVINKDLDSIEMIKRLADYGCQMTKESCQSFETELVAHSLVNVQKKKIEESVNLQYVNLM